MAITVTKRANGNADVRVSVPIAKTAEGDAGTLKAFGWAATSVDADGKPVEDHQHQVIPPDELEGAAYDFAKSVGVANAYFHNSEEEVAAGLTGSSPDVGRLIESVVMTPEKRTAMGLPADPSVAWWVGFEVTDPKTADAIRRGELKEFSIEGTAFVEPFQEAA